MPCVAATGKKSAGTRIRLCARSAHASILQLLSSLARACRFAHQVAAPRRASASRTPPGRSPPWWSMPATAARIMAPFAAMEARRKIATLDVATRLAGKLRESQFRDGHDPLERCFRSARPTRRHLQPAEKRHFCQRSFQRFGTARHSRIRDLLSFARRADSRLPHPAAIDDAARRREPRREDREFSRVCEKRNIRPCWSSVDF